MRPPRLPQLDAAERQKVALLLERVQKGTGEYLIVKDVGTGNRYYIGPSTGKREPIDGRRYGLYIIGNTLVDKRVDLSGPRDSFYQTNNRGHAHILSNKGGVGATVTGIDDQPEQSETSVARAVKLPSLIAQVAPLLASVKQADMKKMVIKLFRSTVKDLEVERDHIQAQIDKFNAAITTLEDDNEAEGV